MMVYSYEESIVNQQHHLGRMFQLNNHQSVHCDIEQLYDLRYSSVHLDRPNPIRQRDAPLRLYHIAHDETIGGSSSETELVVTECQ